MSKRDPLLLLEDIMLAIKKIGRYTSLMDHDAFIRDELNHERMECTWLRRMVITP
jgi:uncharacterized protein with HEPN domain